MTPDTEDTAQPRRRVQRHQPRIPAEEARRRLQLGTGYPHRGPAPAYRQRQLTYQPSGAGGGRRIGRLRVLASPTNRHRAPPERS